MNSSSASSAASADAKGTERHARRAVAFAGIAAALLAPQSAFAWGYEGHEVIAAIARSYLTPGVRQKVDMLLAADMDTLTGHDMLSAATWADAYRAAGHRETAAWHFADTEIERPSLREACFGFPASSKPTSAGPANDCVVDRIKAFTAEVADPTTVPAERIIALKFVLHFVGDEHQPLHASDHHDRGGNCVRLALGGPRTSNLHSFWDTGLVETLGRDPKSLADQLRARITPHLKAEWEQGDPESWAMEANRVAMSTTYALRFPAGCDRDAAPIALTAPYQENAQKAVALQLQRAGVRLALVLNRSLAGLELRALPSSTPSGVPHRAKTTSDVSAACSAEADARGLHGRERQRFRSRCKRTAAGG